jgi:drug/metabolite transporter (DMT)-like permease
LIWRWGIEMGLYMFLGFSLQAIGLQYTTAQRSGFLLYLNVKFVPFLALLFYQRPISTVTILSALTAFTGTGLLAYNPNEQHDGSTSALSNILSLNVGDLWTIAAAIASAMFILRLETASNAIIVGSENNNNNNNENDNTAVASFNAACLWVVTSLALLWTMYATITSSSDENLNVSNMIITIWTEIKKLLQNHLWELIYLGGITTALANYIQTKAQRYISAERASIIYAMDPVYGAFFSYILLGETLNGVTGWMGATLIVIAAATNAFLDGTKDSTNESTNESGN